MTIDEKLSHFYDVTIEDAQAKAAGILEEHRKALASSIFSGSVIK